MVKRRSRESIQMSFDLPFLTLRRTRKDPSPLSPSEIAALADEYEGLNITLQGEKHDELKYSTKRNRKR